MAITLDVVGSTPISIASATGGQRIVPLSALQFNGSKVEVKESWRVAFTAAEAKALITVAEARVAGGELARPPAPAPLPALVFTATETGPESNGVIVHLTQGAAGTSPLTTEIGIVVTETDTYSGLKTPADVASAVGSTREPTKPGDPRKGTGLVRVKTTGDGTEQPKEIKEKALGNTGLDVVDTTGKTLFTLEPRPGSPAAGELTVAVSQPRSDGTFTITARYHSKQPAKFTAQTLDALPDAVTYVVTAGAPPGGAALPAATPAAGLPLTGGGPGTAAQAVAYTTSAA